VGCRAKEGRSSSSTTIPVGPRCSRGVKARPLEAIGTDVVRIEHVGSTAVPGLGAKPIIDILVGLRRLQDATALIRPLERLGYEYVPEYDSEIPDRRYFRKGAAPITSTSWRSVGSSGRGIPCSGTSSALILTWLGATTS